MPDHQLTEKERAILASIIRLQRRDLPPDAVTPQVVANRHQAAFSWEVAGLSMNVFRHVRRRSPKGGTWERVTRKDHASPVALKRHERIIGLAERLAIWGYLEFCQFDGRGGWHRRLGSVVNRHGFSAETYPYDWGFLLRLTGKGLQASHLSVTRSHTEKPKAKPRAGKPFTEKDLIDFFGVPDELAGALHVRLYRYRQEQKISDGWTELDQRKPRSPRYAYFLEAVTPIVKKLMGTKI